MRYHGQIGCLESEPLTITQLRVEEILCRKGVTLEESAVGGDESTKVRPGAAGLVRAYNTALELVCSRVNFEVEMRPGGLGSKEVEIRREELKGRR